VIVMRALDVLETLELLGSGQWGLVTTAQANEAGVSKMQLSRLAARGTVQRVRHGVYAPGRCRAFARPGWPPAASRRVASRRP
jgi:predicted transcriptional regulator of viral defense system